MVIWVSLPPSARPLNPPQTPPLFFSQGSKPILGGRQPVTKHPKQVKNFCFTFFNNSSYSSFRFHSVVPTRQTVNLKTAHQLGIIISSISINIKYLVFSRLEWGSALLNSIRDYGKAVSWKYYSEFDSPISLFPTMQ